MQRRIWCGLLCLFLIAGCQPTRCSPGASGDLVQCPKVEGLVLVTTRRFPPPWTVEEQSAAFVVCDHSRQEAGGGD